MRNRSELQIITMYHTKCILLVNNHMKRICASYKYFLILNGYIWHTRESYLHSNLIRDILMSNICRPMKFSVVQACQENCKHDLLLTASRIMTIFHL